MRWKWIAGLGLLIIVLALGVIYGVLVTYDYNKLKPELARMVQENTGRELYLGGEMNLAMGWSPTLVVTDAALANAPWGSQPQMITIEKLQLQVRLLPLLLRDVDVNQIALSGVRVLLETGPDARRNWDFLAGKTPGGLRTLKPAEIEIERVRIANLNFTFYHHQTKSKTQFSITRLVMNRQGPEEQLALNLRGDFYRQPVALNGTVGSPHQLLKNESYPVQFTVRSSSVAANIKGTIGNIHALSGCDLQLDGSGQDLSEIGSFIGQELPTTDQFALKGRLTGSALTLSLEDAQGSARRGSLHFSVNGTVKDFFSLEGMDLQSRLSGRELAEIGPLVGAELPNFGAFDVQGKLTGSPEALSLKPLEAVIDKSDFKGWATAAFVKRPKLTVRLDSSVVDFTALMKSLEKDEPKPKDKEKPGRRLFSDRPLPLEGLQKMDADIVLKAEQIHARDARLGLGRLVIVLEDQDLRIEKFEATYKETRISGKLQIKHGETPRVATDFLVQSFDLGELLKETGVSDEVRAVIDIAGHGQSRGNSVNDLMANLDGAIGIVMGEGYLTRYLDMLAGGLSQKVTAYWDHPKEVDQINCAVVQFDIHEGVAASRAFVFDTRVGIIIGEGDINLGTEKIEFLLVPESKHPDLRLRPNLKVSGTVMVPEVSVDKLSLLTSGARGLSTLVVGPLGLLAPFAHLGANKAHPCDVRSIGQSGSAPPAAD